MRADRDQNQITTALGISSTDSITPIQMVVDPITNKLLVDVVSDSITVVPATIDKHDQNGVPTMYGISTADGETLIPIRTDSSGNLLATF